MALGSGIFILRFLLDPQEKFNNLFFAVLGFAGFTFFINVIHYMIDRDFTFLLSSVYYAYNALLFMMVVDLFRQDHERTAKVVYIAVGAALIMEIIYIQFFPGIRSSRFTGTFHNPNQLSYFALLCACIIIALRLNKTFRIQDLVLILCAGYLQSVALSKAGIISYALIFMALFFSRALSFSFKSIQVFFGVCLLIFAALDTDTFVRTAAQFDELMNSVARIQNIGQEADDNLEGRGYDRIARYPENLILGAGEGAYYKYTLSGKNKEMHSGLGTLIFSYGVTGMFLLGLVFYMIFNRSPAVMWALLFALMLYGLTHQNLRFSMLWLFLACAVYTKATFIPLREERLLRGCDGETPREM